MWFSSSGATIALIGLVSASHAVVRHMNEPERASLTLYAVSGLAGGCFVSYPVDGHVEEAV